MSGITSEEKKSRRRTIVVYAKAGADGSESLELDGGVPADAPLSPKEKLMKTKNLMYSDREAELLEDLCRLLISVQPGVLRELFNVTEKADHDDLADCLVALSFAGSKVFELIKYFIEQEFQTNNQGQIMRENAEAAKLIKAYLKRVGGDYLIETLSKFVKDVVLTERKVNFEVNPAKVQPPESVEENRLALEGKVTAILKHLTSKEVIAKLPPGIRIICKYVADAAKKVVPDQVHTFIGSFIFLRFLNPAISSPDSAGVLPPGKWSSQGRRNLVLITKVLQNLSNGRSFSNKEQFMMCLNPYVEKNLSTVKQYFDDIVNWTVQEKTVHPIDELAEVTVQDLHIFHSLVFQFKDKISSLLTKEEDKNAFYKILDMLGSYEKKVSFSFLGDVEQRAVKQMMAGRRDEASYIGNIVRTDNSKSAKKEGSERMILIVTLYRVLWARPNGKIVQESPLLDLKSIVSLDPKSLTLVFKDGEVSQTSEEVDIIIDCIRRAYEFCYHGLPEDRNPQLRIEPKSRISEIPHTDEPCDGVVSCYKALCDYYGVTPHPRVCWDLDNLYANNKTLDMKKFTDKYLDPLSDKDSLPLLHAFAFNHYFTTLTIRNMKFSPQSFQGIIEALSVNSTLEELTLSDVQLTEKSEKCWTMLFDALFSNNGCSLRRIFLGNSPIDDKALVPFGLWLKKYTGPLTHLDLAYTAGEKAGKSTGLLTVFEALSTNTALSNTIEVLKLDGNKLPSLEPSLARVLQVAPKIRVVTVRATNCDLNVLTSLGLVNNEKSLRVLKLSQNKFAKPEQWTHFLRYVESPGCLLTELDLSSTQIPVPVLKDILAKFNPNATVKINVADNNLGKAGAQAIAAVASGLSMITGLDISDNGLSDEGLAALFEGLYNHPSLNYLNVARNWSKQASGKRDTMLFNLNQLINHTNCPLEVLHMAGNKEFRLREAIVPFLAALGKNKRITEVDISGHGFGDKGANQLARTLVVNVMLTTILWDDNSTGVVGLSNIRDGIESNNNIKVMPMPWRDLAAVMTTTAAEQDKFILTQLLDQIEKRIMENQTV